MTADPDPIRVGLLCVSEHRGSEWLAFCRRAEALGYWSCLAVDHLVGPQPAPIAACAVAATATTGLRVGTMVLNNDLRDPLVLFREVEVLSNLAPGRLEIGLGAGWMSEDYQLRGQDMASPGDRIDRLEATARALRALLAGGDATLGSRLVSRAALALAGAPGPQPALIVGGSGPRILAMAAREADVVAINPPLRSGRFDAAAIARHEDRDRLRRRVELVRSVPAPTRWRTLQIAYYIVEVAPSRSGAARPADGLAASLGVRPARLTECAHALIGTVDEIVARLVDQRRELGISYVCVPDHKMAEFAPVVRALQGA